MYTSTERDEDLTHGDCGCGNCDAHDELDFLDDEDVYDDPFEVVMYDIKTGSDDLYALIDMLMDSDRSWYAKRRFNALAASGPLSELVAAIIVDSLGRRWNPLLHPRDRYGRFIETGGFVRWLSKGDWLRGQISRIDSNGTIHVKADGNDRIPDGEALRFKPEMAAKMVSTKAPVADLDAPAPDVDAPDLDTEIPGFPEASATQRRIYNALRDGDMPAEDLDVYRASDDPDMPASDFANEIVDLEERGLVAIDRSEVADGASHVVRRIPADGEEQKAEIDVDDIEDVPDDDTPDLEDSPGLTKSQRSLLDTMAELDRGEGDGIGIDEIGDASDEDLIALLDAGALVEGDGGVYHLENPEGAETPEAAPSAPGESDLITEIFDAAALVSDDPDVQEAFQHYAEELANPGDDNNAPLPEGISPAKQRNAEAAANKWWADRSGEAPVDDTSEVEQASPKDSLNPRNQALADQLVAEYFPEDEFLDSNIGVQYRDAVKRLFDAEDLAENGFDVQADAERDRANRALRKIEVPEEDIEGWPIEVQNVRNAEREAATAETVPDDVAAEDVPDVIEEEVVPDVIEEEVPEEVVPDVVEEEVPVEDATDEPAAPSLESLQSLIDASKADDSDVEPADDVAVDTAEDNTEVVEEVAPVSVDEEVLPDAEPAEADVVDDVAVEELDTVADDAARSLDDAERDLLTRIQNGGQAKRSERTLEDSLIDEGLLEEDENGDSRLTDAGQALLEPEVAEEVVPEADADVDVDLIPEEEEALADVPDVAPDAVADDVDVPDAADVPEADVVDDAVDDVPGDPTVDVPEAEADVAETDDATPAETTNAQPAPTLPDPANPNDATPGFRWISGAGGINAGGTYEVLADNGPLKAGDMVYVKNGRSYEHAQNEILANRLYALGGVEVPEVFEGSTGDRIASRIIDDLHELDIYDPADAPVLDRVRDEFVFDAWLANWDGMNPGNTLVTPDGTPYRIDVGSAMEYRAQGGLKGSAFNESAGDIDTLRSASINYDTARIFGPMDDAEVAVSVERLAQVDPAAIRSTIAASGLPDKDALADKMIARRDSLLQRFGVSDPFGATATVDDPDVAVDPDVDDTIAPDPVPSPAPAVPSPSTATIASQSQNISARAQKSRRDFASRTNPHLEPVYTDGGNLVMADGSELDFATYYHSASGGEGKHGRVVEVLDQEKYPGWVKMEFLDGEKQVRHVLGTGTGSGGLVPSSQDDVDDWERQTSVTGDKATEVVDPADFPMGDGNPPLVGSQIVFDVGGEEQYGTLLYFNPKWDNGGRAHIIPEGGGKMVIRPVRRIRAQTPNEIDSDATPLVPYQQQEVVAQYLPQPRYSANGTLLSREDKPVNVGDWLRQRAGGDGLIGEVIDIPDQNLYPGWVTLRFPDGEERSRHVEGFTEVGKMRGAGGLHHVAAPDPSTWTRQRRVKGEEGDVLSYDFSNLKTSDNTPIQVGQQVFGVDRKGTPVAGLLIRINPHLKRNGQTVPTGFVWQNGREVTVDVDKITNTLPPAPTSQPIRTRTITPRPVPSNVRPPAQRPSVSQPPRRVAPAVPTRPALSTANTPPAYTPAKGVPLTDGEIDGLDIDQTRLSTSNRTNGVHATLAAIYEAQDFDGLPLVVDQAEAARLAREEGYVPILRSVLPGTDRRSGMKYDDAFRYGQYFAGDGIHGNGSYFAYGEHALSESSAYGNSRIYALIRPADMNLINKGELREMQKVEYDALREAMNEIEDHSSDEYKKLRKRLSIISDLGQYAAAQGYDGIIVKNGNSHDDYRPPTDSDLSSWGYFVLLNRTASVAVDVPFYDNDDIFNKGFPADLAPPAGDLASPTAPGVV